MRATSLAPNCRLCTTATRPARGADRAWLSFTQCGRQPAVERAEFWKARQTVFVSATPGDWEMEVSGAKVVEQVIRPTGCDLVVEVRPTTGQSMIYSGKFVIVL